jgi:hypothetical protein
MAYWRSLTGERIRSAAVITMSLIIQLRDNDSV